MTRESTAPPRWRGRPIPGDPAEPLAPRLSRSALRILQRSIRYHRPRAVFCGTGQCTNCLVRVNGRPNVRSCTYVPKPGDLVTSENSWPSPSYDLLGLLDLVFPRGLDTLHGFTRPSFATPLYHRIVRRLAGYGSVPDPSVERAPSVPSVPPLTVPAVVIGAGDAGVAAARRFVERGVAPLLVDRRRTTAPLDGTTFLGRTSAVFLPPPQGSPPEFSVLLHTEGGAARRVRSPVVVIASGGYDAAGLMANGDRPGVLPAEGALALWPSGPIPFQRAVVFGGGPRVLPVLARFGDVVDALVAPGAVAPPVVERASALEIPIFPRTLLHGVVGRRRVRGVRLMTRGAGPSTTLPADAVLLAHRRLPNPQLFYQAGARMQWRADPGAYVPEIFEHGGTSVPGLFAAGTAAGVFNPEAARQSGIAAADAALGTPPSPLLSLVAAGAGAPAEMEGYIAELLARPRGRGKWILCPCEDVLLSEVEEAVRRGYHGVEVVKRHTGVGTGLCQGRYCLPDLLLVLAALERRPPAEVGYITQRPPVFVTPLEALAELAPSMSTTESLQ